MSDSTKLTQSKYYSCQYINKRNMVVADNPLNFWVCCERNRGLKDAPVIKCQDTPKQTIESFLEMLKKVVAEGYLPLDSGERVFTKDCVKCKYYKPDNWENDGLINNINFSMYPSPCNGRCSYCSNVRNNLTGFEHFKKKEVIELYEKAFDTIDYALKNGAISPNVSWEIATGEITVHPFKDRIYDLIGSSTCMFLSNFFKFDERIAENLAQNPNSGMIFSIDAGTPQTWHKIKGFDNFHGVLENMARYRKAALKDNQINLKYIICLGINDSDEEFTEVIKIIKENGLKKIQISRDLHFMNKSVEIDEMVIHAAARFYVLLNKNQLTCNYYNFTPPQWEKVVSSANELLLEKDAPKSDINEEPTPTLPDTSLSNKNKTLKSILKPIVLKSKILTFIYYRLIKRC